MLRRVRIGVVLLTVGLLFATLSSATASVWPGFGYDQNHTGQSIYTGPVSSQPLLSFSVITGGRVTSPCIESNGVIYVTSADHKLYAINGSTGAQLWTYTAGGALTSSPSIAADSTVHFGGSDGYIYSVFPNGTLYWKYHCIYPVSMAVVISNKNVTYAGESNADVWAVNITGGFVGEWASIDLNPILSVPAIISWNNSFVYGGPDSTGILYHIDSSFKSIFQLSIGRAMNAPVTIGLDGSYFVGDTGGYLNCINSAGVLKWSYKTGGSITSGAAVGPGGIVYVGSSDSKLYAFNSSFSSTPLRTFVSNGAIVANPVLGADGTLYFGTQGGRMYGLNSSTFAVLWTWNTTGSVSVSASAAIGSDHSLWFGSDTSTLFGLMDSSPSASPTPSATASPTLTVSASVSVTVSVTVSATVSLSVSVSASGTKSDTVSSTVTSSSSVSVSSSSSTSVSRSSTNTVTSSMSGTVTITVSPTATASTTLTISVTTTSSSSVTATDSSSITSTGTSSPSYSVSSTYSLTGSVGASLSGTPTDSASATDSATGSPSASASGTVTTSGSSTESITFTATESSTCSGSSSPSTSVSESNTDSSTVTPSVSPSVTLSSSGSSTDSNTFTSTSSESVSESVTVSTTVSPTDTRTPSDSKTITTSASVTVSTTDSESQTASFSASDSVSRSTSLTDTDSQSMTSSVTESATVTVTITDTATASSSPSLDASISQTPTLSNTLSPSDSNSGRASISVSSTTTVSETYSAATSVGSSVTLTLSGSTTTSSTPSGSPSVTASPGPIDVDCVLSPAWSPWSNCTGNSSCATTGLSVSYLPILVFPSGNGQPCAPLANRLRVETCSIDVITADCGACDSNTGDFSDYGCGHLTSCGGCNEGQHCGSSADCASGLMCSSLNTCVGSSAVSSTYYVLDSVVLVGVNRSAFANPSLTAAFVNAIVYHVLLWGVSDVSVSSVSLLSETELDGQQFECSLQITGGTTVDVSYATMVAFVIACPTESCAAQVLVALQTNNASFGLELEQAALPYTPGLCAVQLPKSLVTIGNSQSQPLIPSNSHSGSNAGAIVGGIFAVVAVLCIAGGCFVWRRRDKKRKELISLASPPPALASINPPVVGLYSKREEKRFEMTARGPGIAPLFLDPERGPSPDRKGEGMHSPTRSERHSPGLGNASPSLFGNRSPRLGKPLSPPQRVARPGLDAYKSTSGVEKFRSGHKPQPARHTTAY